MFKRQEDRRMKKIERKENKEKALNELKREIQVESNLKLKEQNTGIDTLELNKSTFSK